MDPRHGLIILGIFACIVMFSHIFAIFEIHKLKIERDYYRTHNQTLIAEKDEAIRVLRIGDIASALRALRAIRDGASAPVLVRTRAPKSKSKPKKPRIRREKVSVWDRLKKPDV